MKYFQKKIIPRIKYLVNPGDTLTENIFYCDSDAVLKQKIIDMAGQSSFKERFSLILCRKKTFNIDFWLSRQIKLSDDGSHYFDLGDKYIFFEPDYPVSKYETYMRGVLLILKESYIWSDIFFSKNVYIHPGDIVFDLGGNLGTSAMLFSKLTGPSGHVFSFEPVHHQLLSKNIKSNKINNVTVLPYAVVDRKGEITFSLTDIGIDARVASDTATHTIQVPSTSVDDFMQNENVKTVNFMKFDIEGAEEMAIRGEEQTIRRFHPRCTVASYHTDPSGSKQHIKLKRLLQQLNYQLREIPGKHLYAW